MSFEDNMIEDGFSDEQDYMSHLESEADDWYDSHNSGDNCDDWEDDDDEDED